MLMQEGFSINYRDYIHTYSNENYYIVDEDGNKYIDAFDLPSNIKQYFESEELIVESIDSEIVTAGELIREFQKIEQHAEKINEVKIATTEHEVKINSHNIQLESHNIQLESQENSIQEQNEITNDLVDAITELGDLTAENTVDSEDLMDAITELADLVAQLLEGE